MIVLKIYSVSLVIMFILACCHYTSKHPKDVEACVLLLLLVIPLFVYLILK